MLLYLLYVMCFSFKWKSIIISFFLPLPLPAGFELLEFFLLSLYLSFHTHAFSLSLSTLLKDCCHDNRKKWKSEMNMEICTRKKRSLIFSFVCLFVIASTSPIPPLFSHHKKCSREMMKKFHLYYIYFIFCCI